MFTDQDLIDFSSRGTTFSAVKDQIHRFQSGFPYIVLQRPCSPEDGIEIVSPSDEPRLIDLHDRAAFQGRISKFVPASGVGSRMFQRLFALKNRYADMTRTDLEYKIKQGNKEAEYGFHFFNSLTKYPFYSALCESIGEEKLREMMATGQFAVILERLLTKTGFNYPNKPKGLLPFHRYNEKVRTPIHEHLVEAQAYAKTGTGRVSIHFTVSPDHLDSVQQHINAVIRPFEKDTAFELTFSTQKSSTDIIAVDMDDQPFRDGNGRLVFRAGGHGALLENLNDLQGDIIFIKNIDNVVPDHIKGIIHRHKRILGGYLVEIQQEIFDYSERLENGSTEFMNEVLDFCRTRLGTEPPKSIMQTDTSKQRFLSRILDRPLRVCGMVKNTGEPGGGPFWVKSGDGGLTPQIVESSQINTEDSRQNEVFKAATHFNPVDLVCGVRNRWGDPYDLRRFRDPNTGFISSKSKDGRSLKAMEYPGLWNGSMADWNTIFVEVPVETSNPVKTIDDLLRPAHQPVKENW